MDADIKPEFGWSLSSFGHGMFQQIVMKPIVYQATGLIEDSFPHKCSPILLADQPVVVGVLLLKPQGYKGSITDFTSYIQMAILHIEFGFSVLHEGSSVLHETFYMAAIQQSNFPALERALRVTKAGVAITFTTILNIAKQYLNIPLQFMVTMNLIQSQGKPFNQRLIMDKTEMNVRLLMDLNRYRPQKVPERSLVVPIQIVHPLRVSSSVREITPDLSILSISVSNVHNSAHISLDSIIFHTDRMTQSIINGNNEQHGSLHLLGDLFHITLLNPSCTTSNTAKKSDCIKTVVISPKEEYTFLYNVSLRNPTEPALHLFATPITLYWSVTNTQINITDHVTPVLQTNNNELETVHNDSMNNKYSSFQSELDYIVNWSIGTNSAVQTSTTDIFLWSVSSS